MTITRRSLLLPIISVLLKATMGYGDIRILPNEATAGVSERFTLRVSNESRNTETVATEFRFLAVTAANPALVTTVKPVTLETSLGLWRDQDRDGIRDDLEQDLLLKFTPVFMIDADDCDVLPAEFILGATGLRPIVRNGTIYGQVFPRGLSSISEPLVEIHYYHLWSRDCGRAGHLLDAEHVSVLIRAKEMDDPASAWRALYWYAAAHEETLCNASNGAMASALDAEDRGATVWISRGKHGSFLSESKCRWGCGGDSCKNVVAMLIEKLINIGEPDAPLNGADWTGSKEWPLKEKMRTDFSDVIIARLDDSGADAVVLLNSPPPPTKAVILGSNSSLEAFLIGNAWAGRSLFMGGSESVHAAAKGLNSSGRSLLLVGRKFRSLLRFKGN